MTKDIAKIALVTGASRGLGKNTALALGKKGVDAIATYRNNEAEAIATDFAGGGVRDNSDINSFIASQTALGRVGEPDDIGGALAKLTEGIAALLSEDNRWVNAQRIEVSGGQSL
jgi:NAD(P)-dependent dehydrogenase (short-subunit alcohol dehydrogenase family)